jgi:hypothetical protein
MPTSKMTPLIVALVVVVGILFAGWQYRATTTTSLPAEQNATTTQPTEIVLPSGAGVEEAVDSATVDLDRGASNLPVPAADDLSDQNLGL